MTVAYWHPVTWISHMLDCQIFGLRPGWHHMTNVVLHGANTVLVFLIFRAMTGVLWRSALVAALFAIHPLHVESVAWVAERKDVLSTFFGLLATRTYVSYANRPSGKRYAAVAGLFGLSLLSKPMWVTFPGWHRRDRSLPPAGPSARPDIHGRSLPKAKWALVNAACYMRVR